MDKNKIIKDSMPKNNIGKKHNSKTGRKTATAALICIMCLGIAGCTQGTMGETGTPDNTGTPADTHTPDSTETPADTGTSEGTETPTDTSPDNGSGLSQDNESSENTTAGNNSSENSSGSKSAAQTELSGEIREIGDMQFAVNEIITLNDNSGGLEAEIMVLDKPEDTSAMSLITVNYDEQTVFTKQTIWDGGAKHEEEAATSADLKKGLSVNMSGNYEGDIFHASQIQIVQVLSS